MKSKLFLSLMFVTLVVVSAALLMTGCYFTGKRAPSVEFSGWMGDDVHRLLQKGGPNQALYTYAKPGVNSAWYTKMLLDPVVVYNPAKENPTEDVQKSANNFYSILVKTLSKDYQMVKEPGPNTVRVKVAITNISPGSGTAQTITSVLPIGAAVALVSDWISGKPAGSGEISVEVILTDARTNELLGAGVDRRIADKSLRTAMDTWNAVTKVQEIWAKMFAYRLCKARGGKDCVPAIEK